MKLVLYSLKSQDSYG